jgi:hypothetical protein
MITLLQNKTKTRNSTTMTARERQRSYCDSIFELRIIVNNIYKYLKLYDIKRAENDDVRDSFSRHSEFDFRSNLKRQHSLFSVLYRCLSRLETNVLTTSFFFRLNELYSVISIRSYMQAAQAMISMKFSFKNCFAFSMRFAHVKTKTTSSAKDMIMMFIFE